MNMIRTEHLPNTYDHRALNTRLPVRSAIFKQRTGGLVVRWVTTGESPLLYVFDLFLLFHSRMILPFVDLLGESVTLGNELHLQSGRFANEMLFLSASNTLCNPFKNG
jgi:hypothetical protein